MPRHKAPLKVAAIIQALQKTMEAAMEDAAAGTPHLDTIAITRVQEGLNHFEILENAVVDAKSARKKSIQTVDPAVENLKAELRLTWDALTSYVNRGVIPSGYYQDFGLPAKGTVPQRGGREAWLARGQQAVNGYEVLMQAGYDLPFNADAVRQASETAQNLYGEVKRWKAAVERAERARRAVRGDMEDTYATVYSRLRDALRRQSDSHTRAVMRRYGIVFIYAPTEADLAQNEAPAQQTGADVSFGTPTHSGAHRIHAQHDADRAQPLAQPNGVPTSA